MCRSVRLPVPRWRETEWLQINTLETINTVLRPTFQLAVRDDIIRKNPVDGAYCEVKNVMAAQERAVEH